MNFNTSFKMKSWQSILAANLDAAVRRQTKTSREDERRISLIDYESTLEHVVLSIGPAGPLTGKKHLITGATARLALRAAPAIRLSAGVSNFWQTRHGRGPEAPGSLPRTRRDQPNKKARA